MSRRAAVYVRISSDPTGERLGVQRQLTACLAKAAERGWTVARVYEDNDVSASSGKPRPEYQAMLAHLEAGSINAVIVWDLDRLTRRPIEIEHFIDIADRCGVALASVGGDVDLATDNGRMFARIKGAVARAEVERKSARQKAANTQRAEAGKPPGGRRAFGYSADGMSVIEAEAAEIRHIAASVLSGGSIRGGVAGLRARGVLTTSGNAWQPTEMRRLLGNPRYAGQRVHRGEVVGPGLWPGILGLDDWRALQGVLSDPARRKAGRPERYLLSGVARCDECGGRIYGAREPRGRTYLCETRRHVARRAEVVDAFVQGLVIEQLCRSDAHELFSHNDSRAEVAALREEEHALRARLDGLSEAFMAGDITREQLARGSERGRTRLADVAARLADCAVTPVLADLLQADNIEAAYEHSDLDRQRAVVAAMFSIRLRSPGRGARRFDPETVAYEVRASAAGVSAR